MVLRCACCHMALTSASTQKKNGKAYRYYRSIVRHKKGKEACQARPCPPRPSGSPRS